MTAQTIHSRCRYSKYAPRQYHFPEGTYEGTLERIPGWIYSELIPGHEDKIFCVGFSVDKKTGVKTYLDGRHVPVIYSRPTYSAADNLELRIGIVGDDDE